MQEIIRVIFRYLHFIGVASVAGGLIVQMTHSKKKITAITFHGALTQFITGVVLVLVTIHEADHIKVTVKFVLLLVLFVLLMIQRKRDEISKKFYAVDLSLVFVILGVAVFWRSYAG